MTGRSALSLLAIAVLLVVQGVLHAHTRLYLDVASVAVAYFALERPILNGAAASLFVGYVQDVSAGVPGGLHAAASVLAFLLVRVAVSKLPWSGSAFAAVVSLVTTGLVLLLVLGIDGLLGPGGMSLRGALPALPTLALGAIVLCYPVHRLLARIDERLGRTEEDFVLR